MCILKWTRHPSMRLLSKVPSLPDNNTSTMNLKAMKVDIQRNQPIPLVDEEAIKTRRATKLVIVVHVKEQAIQSFGVANKIKNKMKDQHNGSNTRRQAQ